MKFKKILLLLALSLLVFAAACGDDTEDTDSSNEEESAETQNDNLNTTGMPIVNEPISISIMARQGPATATDYNEVTIWKEYEDLTGIHIDWDVVPREGFEERRNLALASDDLPDAFYTSALSNVDLQRYGDQGAFVNLDGLIEEYMPNLTALLEENPDIKNGMTFPNGAIYSLPTIYDPEFSSVLAGQKGWIRKDWLDELGMDIPETTDEFYEFLKAVKESDLLGDGEDNEIPYGGYRTHVLTNWLKGAFGIGNRGIKHLYLDADPETGDVRFYPTADGYKDMLEYLNKLYSEGLIAQNIFTIEGDQHHALASQGLYGSTVANNPEVHWGPDAGEFVGMPALVGPNGDQLTSYITSTLAHMSGFVVTKENEHLPETLRWMDYFYGDEGTKLFFMGVEGVTYEENENGEVDYLDELKNDPNLSLEEKLADHVTWPGGGYPGIVKEEYFNGAESHEGSIEATEIIEDYFPEEVWPSFTYTNEETSKLTALAADIEKYVDEMKDKFITGDESLDEWDDYINTLESMGLEEYMSIQEAAYERYKGN